MANLTMAWYLRIKANASWFIAHNWLFEAANEGVMFYLHH